MNKLFVLLQRWLILVAAILSTSTTVDASATCDIDSSTIVGSFNLSTHYGVNTGVRQDHQSELIIWRRKSEVAHQHPEREITEVWHQLQNGRIRPVRYFDAYRRGIEYQPDEVGRGNSAKNWSSKTQLVSDRFRESMTFERSEGTGCERLEYYTKQETGKTYAMVWSPSLKFPLEYTEIKHQKEFRLKLTMHNTASQKVNAFFYKRDTYQTTDYADIGDNENDPFLGGMINLGFIEHGASGFYNTNGEILESQHSHGSHLY